MDKTETMRQQLKYFNLVLIASEANVCYPVLASFRQGNTAKISTENYDKVQAVLESIADKIRGG
jgi:hypothetical protein